MLANSTVSSGYSLITTTPNGCTITWDIDAGHTDNLANNSLINNTEENILVKLFATITDSQDNSEELTYEVTIEGNETNIELTDYYSSLTATSGEALKQELRSLITSTHTKITSYDECKTYLQQADEDPNNSNNMILFYSGESIAKTDNMNIWNREHVWCQSHGWFTTSKAGSDLHHIRPCDPSLNSSRNNDLFGEGDTYFYPNGTYSFSDGTTIQLGDFRGDVARILFYLVVRYSESDDAEYDITCIAESYEILLKWSQEDPVSINEINRNNYIYEVQGNRNPFIDYPEFAEEIWG